MSDFVTPESGPRPTPRNPWFDRTFSSGSKRRSLAVVDGTLSPPLPVPPAAANDPKEQSRQDHFSEEGLGGSDCQESTE